MTNDYQERDRVRDQRSADPPQKFVPLTEVRDAWWQTLLERIDELERRVDKLEDERARNGSEG